MLTFKFMTFLPAEFYQPNCANLNVVKIKKNSLAALSRCSFIIYRTSGRDDPWPWVYLPQVAYVAPYYAIGDEVVAISGAVGISRLLNEQS